MPFSKLAKARQLHRKIQSQEEEIRRLRQQNEKENEKEATDKVIIPATPKTPKSMAVRLAEEMEITPVPDRVQKLLPYTVTLHQVKKAPTSVKQALFRPKQGEKDEGKKKKRPCRVLSKKIKLSRDYLFAARKKSGKRVELATKHRKIITDFLQRPDNSFEMPGKKDHLKGTGIFSLCDTMRNLQRISQFTYF